MLHAVFLNTNESECDTNLNMKKKKTNWIFIQRADEENKYRNRTNFEWTIEHTQSNDE